MGYNLGEYHIIGVVVKLENRLDINIIGVFKALLIRHYNCLLSRPVDSATKKKKTIQLSSNRIQDSLQLSSNRIQGSLQLSSMRIQD